MDITVINPCESEIAKMKAAGLTISTVHPKTAFTQDVGVKEIFGVPILFGYNMRADMVGLASPLITRKVLAGIGPFPYASSRHLRTGDW